MKFSRLVPNVFYSDINDALTFWLDCLEFNLNKVTLRPWGAQEFAITDKQLGVVIQQWQN